MQGINKARHVHLIDALLQMERLLGREQRDCDCIQQAVEYRHELENMHRNYEHLLKDLSTQISVYEALFSEAKINCLGRKLKELKKEISVEKHAFALMIESIHSAYGT